jgi:hypothetical protein
MMIRALLTSVGKLWDTSRECSFEQAIVKLSRLEVSLPSISYPYARGLVETTAVRPSLAPSRTESSASCTSSTKPQA